MKNIRVFLSEIFQFLRLNFSIYLNRRVFVMKRKYERSLLWKRLQVLSFPHTKSLFKREIGVQESKRKISII